MGLNKRMRPGRWSLIAGVCLVAIGVLSFNAWATFTASVTVNQASITAGHMQLTVPVAGATNRLTLGASGIAPGDTMQRALDLTVSNTTTSGIMTGLNVAINPHLGATSALDTDASDGLKVWIAVCSQAWTESGSSPAFTYTCGGSQSNVLGTSGAPTAISTLTSATALSNVSITPNTANHLMIKLTFPSTAGDAFQDATSTLDFTWSGTQRAGTDK